MGNFQERNKMCILETRTQQEEENGNTTEELVSLTEEHKFPKIKYMKKIKPQIVSQKTQRALIMYINFLRLLEDFRCVKDFLIYTGNAENTLTL